MKSRGKKLTMESKNKAIPTPHPELNSVLQDLVDSLQNILSTMCNRLKQAAVRPAELTTPNRKEIFVK